MTPDRAAEEAAIAAFIATKGVTRIDAVDPIDRAIEQWRREKDNRTGAGNGMRAMMQARRGRPRKVTQPQAVAPAAKPKRSHKKKEVMPHTPQPDNTEAPASVGAEPWFAAAMRGTKSTEVPRYGGSMNAVELEPRLSAGGAAHETVAGLAYALFERDGRVHGLDIQHWLTAEAILRNTNTDTGWRERDAKGSYEEAIQAIGEQVKAGRPLPESFVPRAKEYD